jgi:hypothetical protein
MCQKREFVLLPDGLSSVNVRLHSGKEWIVTVRNKDGSATDTMFAANDHQRSNIYLTPKHQLVVMGGSDVFSRYTQTGRQKRFPATDMTSGTPPPMHGAISA